MYERFVGYEGIDSVGFFACPDGVGPDTPDWQQLCGTYDYADIIEFLEGLPGVTSVGRATQALASVSTAGNPDGWSRQLVPVALDLGALPSFGRPIVVSGRLADPNVVEEVVVNEELSNRLAVGVGDQLVVTPYRVDEFDIAGEGSIPPGGIATTVTIVGVTRRPSDLVGRLGGTSIYEDASAVTMGLAWWVAVEGDAARYGVIANVGVVAPAGCRRVGDDELETGRRFGARFGRGGCRTRRHRRRCGLDPDRYGATWDIQVGNVGDEQQEADTRSRLEAVPGIRAVGIKSDTGLGTGADFTLVSFEQFLGDVNAAVINDGRAPISANEIALGRRSMDDFGVGIGDVVTIPLLDGAVSQPFDVVGEVVVNDAISARSAVGALVIPAVFDELVPGSLSQTYAVWIDSDVEREATLQAVRNGACCNHSDSRAARWHRASPGMRRSCRWRH